MGFAGGLLALFTPCVWPIIPMTVSFFLKRNKDRAKGMRDAITYGLAIIVIFLSLGLIVTALSDPHKLNELATSAVFNIFFFLLLVVFALSFFGWFELRLPESWGNKMDSKASSTTGLLSIFLMAFTTGLTFNIANWKSFSSIFGLEIEQIKSFEIYLLIATLIATLVLVFVEFKKNGVKFAFSAPVSDVPETRQLKGVAGTLAMLTPLVPILLVALLKVPVVPAFVAGIIWVLVFTSKSFSKAMNLLVKTCYDGITDAGPAVILMIGIGILYLAVTHSMVKEVLNPFLLAVIPSNRIAYIIFFSLLAPLSLYRGPMNLFGLGSGIAALVIGLGTLSPLAVMGAFLAAERIQGCGDPTNTQNVWTANFAEVDVNTITKKLLPYLWVIAVFGVVLSAFLYF